MKLPTFNQLDHSVGGRPKSSNQKVRLTFYLSEIESELLKDYAIKHESSVSLLIRGLVKGLLERP